MRRITEHLSRHRCRQVEKHDRQYSHHNGPQTTKMQRRRREDQSRAERASLGRRMQAGIQIRHANHPEGRDKGKKTFRPPKEARQRCSLVASLPQITRQGNGPEKIHHRDRESGLHQHLLLEENRTGDNQTEAQPA